MQRYFISPEQMKNNSCLITDQDAHHISKVMRYSVGDEVICCNGFGRSVLAKIAELGKDAIHCDIVAELEENRELPIKPIIAQGLPKGDKLEWVLQKGTELGAYQFVPFHSARSIVKLDDKKEHKKIERWKKIVKEAAEQSHRDRLPILEEVLTFKELLRLEADCKLVAYEHASLQHDQGPSAFHQALQALTPGSTLCVVIGPEGGLDLEEVKLLEANGYQTISLGKRILRTETASQYILSAISFYFEQMGG